MRKDLQIGLAIGGVLLAVLIVYMMIPAKPTVPGSGGGNSQVANSNSTAAKTAADQSSTMQTADAGNPSGSNAVTGATGAGASGRNIALMTSTTPDRNSSGAVGSGETTAAQPPAASAGASHDWSSLLNTPLMTRTPTGGEAPIATEPTASPTAASSGSASPSGASYTRSTSPTDGVASQSINTAQQATLSDPFGAGVSSAAPAAGSRTHRIQTGETYASIAKMMYGDARHASAIEKANPGLDPRRLRPGVSVTLPDIQEVKNSSSNGAAQTASAREPATLSADEYRVVSGDTLERISRKHYGSSTMQEEIYKLNEAKIGSDPNRLKVNTVLKMPAKSSVSAAATGLNGR